MSPTMWFRWCGGVIPYCNRTSRAEERERIGGVFDGGVVLCLLLCVFGGVVLCLRLCGSGGANERERERERYD